MTYADVLKKYEKQYTLYLGSLEMEWVVLDTFISIFNTKLKLFFF